MHLHVGAEPAAGHRRVAPAFAAAALGAMTERCAYLWYVFGTPPDLEDGVEALTQLWARSLRLEQAD